MERNMKANTFKTSVKDGESSIGQMEEPTKVNFGRASSTVAGIT